MSSPIRKKVSLSDVAKKAGVSRSTASLVARGSSLVAEKTRKSVLRVMKEMGYVYNRGAASLRTQSTKTAGLIVADIKNPFYAGVLQGMEETLDEADYNLIVGSTSDRVDKQSRILKTMLEQNVDGIFLCPSAGTTQEMMRELQMVDRPYVLVARYIADVDMDYVGVNNLLGAKAAMEHLFAKGHTKIAFLACDKQSSILEERLQGYRDVMQANGEGRNTKIISCAMTFEGGKGAFMQLLEDTGRAYTAVLCYNDIIACGAMLALNDLGLVPGEDVAVIGADNSSMAHFWHPGITSVSTRPVEAGAEAAKLLLERMRHGQKDFKRILLTPELIVRQSG